MVKFKNVRCEHHVKPLWTSGGLAVYAGSEAEYKYFAVSHGDKLNVTLACITPVRTTTVVTEGFGTAFDVYKSAKYPGKKLIYIDWPDLKAPLLPRGFWDKLVEALSKEKDCMFVHCQGGHGRTGTVLAILAKLMGATKKDPIEWVRKVYCSEAIESDDQIDYVCDILGITTKETAVKRWTNTTQQYGAVGYQGVGNQYTSNYYGESGKSKWYKGRKWDKDDYDFDKGNPTEDVDLPLTGDGYVDDRLADLYESEAVYHSNSDQFYYTAWGRKLTQDRESSIAMCKSLARAHKSLNKKGL